MEKKEDRVGITQPTLIAESVQIAMQEYTGPYSDPDNPPIDLGNGRVGYAKPTGRVSGWYDTNPQGKGED